MSAAPKSGFGPGPRSRVKRLGKRALYDREAVYGVLDAGLLCHVAYVIGSQPYVTPTAYWRQGDRLFWHGSSKSRMLMHLAPGAPVCLNVSLLDGLVLARSGFEHTVNYRSVTAYGVARAVTDEAEKHAAVLAFMERLWPGRWDEVRPPSRQEMKATTVVVMTIEEAAAKIRGGPPEDKPADLGLPCWAGVLPMTTIMGAPEPDPGLKSRKARPGYLKDWPQGAAVDSILRELAKRQRLTGRRRRST